MLESECLKNQQLTNAHAIPKPSVDLRDLKIWIFERDLVVQLSEGQSKFPDLFSWNSELTELNSFMFIFDKWS